MQLPEKYISSMCEVKSMDNELISTGIISSVSEEGIDITGQTREGDIAGYKMPVKVSILNLNKGFLVLTGEVYLYSKEFIRITNLNKVLDYDRRNFFRIDTDMKTFVALGEQVQENEEKISVRIKDLSLGGCMIRSRVPLIQIGGHLHVWLKMMNGLEELMICEVRRIIEDHNHLLYGCEFIGYTERQRDRLCVYIFQCQRDHIRINTMSQD